MSLINILLVILNNSIFYWLLVIDRSITFAQSNPMGDNSRLCEKLVAAALFTHISVPSFLSNLTPSRPFCPALGSILHRGTEWSVLAFWVVLATGAAVATGTFCCCLHVQPLPICYLHFYPQESRVHISSSLFTDSGVTRSGGWQRQPWFTPISGSRHFTYGGRSVCDGFLRYSIFYTFSD